MITTGTDWIAPDTGLTKLVHHPLQTGITQEIPSGILDTLTEAYIINLFVSCMLMLIQSKLHEHQSMYTCNTKRERFSTLVLCSDKGLALETSGFESVHLIPTQHHNFFWKLTTLSILCIQQSE